MSVVEYTDLGFWTSIAQIFLVNLALSGDNAVVIAMAARRVPEDYRNRAILWGGVAAILLRVVFTFSVAYLMQVPGLMPVGGLVLFYVACKLLGEEDPQEEMSPGEATHSVLKAVGMIFVADLTMSLDNVLAVAGASGGHWVHMMIGMFTSIAFIVLCSRYIAAMMNRFHWLVYAGAAILAFTASEMILSSGGSITHFAESHQLRVLVGISAVGICLATGLRSRQPAAGDLPTRADDENSPCLSAFETEQG